MSVANVASRQHLRSASRCQLVVPRHRLSTFGRRAFAVAGPMSWNSLPNSLRESACDDNISDDCFKRSLKTFLFSGYWRADRSRGVHDSAPYKCTFTYLLHTLQGEQCLTRSMFSFLGLEPELFVFDDDRLFTTYNNYIGFPRTKSRSLFTVNGQKW